MFTCPSCHRHIQVHETTCPFCSSALASTTAELVESSDAAPLRRLQSVAAGVGLSAAVTIGALTFGGCTGGDDGESTTNEVEAAAADYGGPEDDFTADDSLEPDMPSEDSTTGGTTGDTGTDTDTETGDTGG